MAFPPVPFREKFFDRMGMISRPWSRWLNEVYGRLAGTSGASVESVASDLSDHILDSSGAHAASAISNSPNGNLAATNVQSALNELQTDVDTRATSSSVTTVASDLSAHIADTTDAHDASAVSYDNASSGLTATDVQDAIDEAVGLVGSLNKYQIKTLSSDVSSDTNPLSDLTFSNLVIGKVYRATFQMDVNIGDNLATIDFLHDGNIIARIRQKPTSAGTSNDESCVTGSVIFTATATTLTFSFDEASTQVLLGNSSLSETWSMIEELNNYQEVSSF